MMDTFPDYIEVRRRFGGWQARTPGVRRWSLDIKAWRPTKIGAVVNCYRSWLIDVSMQTSRERSQERKKWQRYFPSDERTETEKPL